MAHLFALGCAELNLGSKVDEPRCGNCLFSCYSMSDMNSLFVPTIGSLWGGGGRGGEGVMGIKESSANA